MKDAIVLGGRRFLSVGESTVGHDNYFKALLMAAGLVKCVPQEGENEEMFLNRVVLQATGTGVYEQIVGALLIPEDHVKDKTRPGESWTRQICQETASYVESLIDERDKEELLQFWPEVFYPFLAPGMRSLALSATASPTIPLASPSPAPAATDSGTAS